MSGDWMSWRGDHVIDAARIVALHKFFAKLFAEVLIFCEQPIAHDAYCERKGGESGAL